MPSTFDISKTRAAALLAVCALGAGGGLLAGCGDSEKTSDDTVPAEVTTSADGSAATVPGDTDSETVTGDDVQTLPSQTSTSGSGSGGGSTTSSTVTGTVTGSATVPGGSPSTAPDDPGGAAAPDDNGRTTTSGSSGSGSGSSGGSNANQDPDCKPGTGPGQPLPQCEPVSGEDAQENEG